MSEGAVTTPIDGIFFEAMFVRALVPSGAFLEELRDAGLDCESLEPHYPMELWNRCLDIARRHTYAQSSEEEGMRRLGADLIRGYYSTLIGRVNNTAMQILGMERTLERVPRVLQTLLPSLEVELDQEAPKRWRLVLRHRGLVAEFWAGMIEAGARPFDVPFNAEVSERSPDHCVLRLTY